MKAVVLEKRNGAAICLREDGRMMTVIRDCRVGDTIELAENSGAKKGRAIRIVAATVLALALFGCSYTCTTALPVSFVTVDSEGESVELAVNIMDRVIGARPLNDSSAEAAERVARGARMKRVGEAVCIAVDIIGQENAPAVVGVTTENEVHTGRIISEVESKAPETVTVIPAEAKLPPAEEEAPAEPLEEAAPTEEEPAPCEPVEEEPAPGEPEPVKPEEPPVSEEPLPERRPEPLEEQPLPAEAAPGEPPREEPSPREPRRLIELWDR